MIFPITLKRQFNPDILYEEELTRGRRQRLFLFIFLYLLVGILATEIVFLATGKWGSSYAYLPFITVLAMLADSMALFVIPRFAERSYKRFFSQMQANPDVFNFFEDHFEFEEGSPILPENIPIEKEDYPELRGNKVAFSYDSTKILSSEKELILKVKYMRAKFVFIIPKCEIFNENYQDEWDNLTLFLKNNCGVKKSNDIV